MSLPPLTGHDDLRARLRAAADASRLPHSLLLHGPPGVGKQRLGLWLGRLLLCDDRTACGTCRSCRLALRLEHPDLHWFFPLPRPTGASSRDKLREKLEEARMEELDRRRRDSLSPRSDQKATGIYLAAVDEMRARASKRPAMGERAVFVVGDAEAMVPQAASPQAANAFLKLLEEPPADTYVVLTSSRAGALLPTVRSRVLEMRVPPLRTAEVAGFLEREKGLDAEEAEGVARRARGSVGRALLELTEEGEELRDEAQRLLDAVLSGRPADRWEFAAARVTASGARGGYSDLLARVEELLRDLLAGALDRPDHCFQPRRARELAGGRELSAHGLLSALRRVEEARGEASANVNPQAVTANLLGDIARDLS